MSAVVAVPAKNIEVDGIFSSECRVRVWGVVDVELAVGATRGAVRIGALASATREIFRVLSRPIPMVSEQIDLAVRDGSIGGDRSLLRRGGDKAELFELRVRRAQVLERETLALPKLLL